ncbi:MAG: alpha/beta fold hydrolase [Gemmatimonadaceae bacterium]|nr:alpha/beta fold hydrolase [Gemmatimonadaceae bacterium]
MHGLGRSSEDFEGVRRALGNTWPTIAPDLPFHGAAAARTPPDAAATLTAFADTVVAAVHDARAERVALIGHSLGAAVCIEAARRLGPRVAHVIALDALLNPRVYPRQPAALVAVSRVASRLLHPLLAHLLARALLPAPRDPARLHEVVRGLRAVPARVAAEASADLAAWDRDAALTAITAPVTLVPAAPFYRPTAFAALTPRCALSGPVAGSHFFLLERPEETAACLRSILVATTDHTSSSPHAR